MRVDYVLKTNISGEEGKAYEKYDAFERALSGTFTKIPPTVVKYLFREQEDLARAITWLENEEQPLWSVEYKLHLEPEEIKSHPAFWSILTGWGELFDKQSLLSKEVVYYNGLQVDDAREKVYIPKAGGQIIADRLELPTDVILDVEGNQWRVMDFQTLPELEIPLCMVPEVKKEGLPRRFIEQALENQLKEVGFCKTTLFSEGGQIICDSPILLMSGELVDACIQAGGAEAIKHFEPLFLESDPILKDPGFGHLIIPRPLTSPVPQRSFEQMSQDMDQARREAEPLLEIFRSTALYYPALLEALEQIRVKYGLNVLEIRVKEGRYELHSSVG